MKKNYLKPTMEISGLKPRDKVMADSVSWGEIGDIDADTVDEEPTEP